MKRIVICCDGTWNDPDKTEDGVPIATNVVKFAEAIAPKDENGVTQLMYYDAGVGTSGSWFKRLYEGATGAGLSRNILDAYSYLVRSYSPGDELFFIGFSRGAYTVRSLAGLIRNSGILRPDSADMIRHAFALYRSRSKSTHPRRKEATLFRRTYSLSDITPIKFIGVWDTVGSLGNPLLLGTILGRKNRFHDTDLSSTVSYAYHALAIDEKRCHFRPTLWHQQAHAMGQVLEQVWFVGVHSNVGGGYKSTILSDIALEWMSGKANACGLALERPVPGSDLMIAPEESRKGLYKLIPRYDRPIKKPYPLQGRTCEALHHSASSMYKTQPSYRPKNLVEYLSRFPVT